MENIREAEVRQETENLNELKLNKKSSKYAKREKIGPRNRSTRADTECAQ